MFSDVLLTVDFDRTLTAPDSTIPRRNLEAIEYFMANGGTFTMNTGRSLPMARDNVLSKVPMNAPAILYNGACWYDGKEFTNAQVIPLNQEDVIRDLFEKFPKLTAEVQGIANHCIIRKNSGWEDYCTNNHCTWTYGLPKNEPFLKFTFYGAFHDDTVASFYNATPQELVEIEAAIDHVRQMYGDVVSIERACPRLVDMQLKGVNKGASALAMKAQLGKKYLICVGDGHNDISMMDAADFAYCPADGGIADRYENVCVCADGAVADVIYHKIPQILGK